MPSKFVLKKARTGQFRFSLVTPKGQVLVTSEPYDTKRAALNAIRSVQGSADAEIVDETAAAKKSTAGAKKSAGASAGARKKSQAGTPPTGAGTAPPNAMGPDPEDGGAGGGEPYAGVSEPDGTGQPKATSKG